MARRCRGRFGRKSPAKRRLHREDRRNAVPGGRAGGEEPGSQVYVRNKQKACEKAGIASQLHRPPAETTTEELWP